MSFTVTRTISDESIKQAVCLKCSECYGAMAMANALGGSRSDEWEVCHSKTLKEVLDECKARNINLAGLKCSVTDTPIEESGSFKLHTGQITPEQFKTAWAKVKATGKW